ncbi:helix-turn-helix domain-containing protein [Euzebya sp.]|uniref:AraC family transcriptional regulator n=1 Tax=Euzebya sp. TaxID=1971409 RepID=UPI0035192363
MGAYRTARVEGSDRAWRVWVRAGGPDGGWTCARPYPSVVAEVTDAGVIVTLRPPGVLSRSASPVPAVGVDLHPWLVTAAAGADLATQVAARFADRVAIGPRIDHRARIDHDRGPWTPPACHTGHGGAHDPSPPTPLWSIRGTGEGSDGDLLRAVLAAVAAADLPAPDPAVRVAVTAAVRSGRRQDLSRVGLEAGWSPRTLRRRVHRAVGLSPDALRRLGRLESARTALATGGRGPAQVAAAGGWTDQAHMTRDFTALAGYTPAAWQRHVAGWIPGRSLGGG